MSLSKKFSYYLLKEPKLFQDGFYVNIDTPLKKIEPSNNKYLTVELVEFNSKRIFPVKTSEVEFVMEETENVPKEQIKNLIQERYDKWFKKNQ